MPSDRDRTRNVGVHGPERDRIFDESAARRNSLSSQAPRRTSDDDSAFDAPAGEAGGADLEPSHLGEAEQAFERSRGRHVDRPAR